MKALEDIYIEKGIKYEKIYYVRCSISFSLFVNWL